MYFLTIYIVFDRIAENMIDIETMQYLIAKLEPGDTKLGEKPPGD